MQPGARCPAGSWAGGWYCCHAKCTPPGVYLPECIPHRPLLPTRGKGLEISSGVCQSKEGFCFSGLLGRQGRCSRAGSAGCSQSQTETCGAEQAQTNASLTVPVALRGREGHFVNSADIATCGHELVRFLESGLGSYVSLEKQG